MTQEEMTEGRHLGDGVYASYDGYQIWLAANDHKNRVIALEPAVLKRLVEYREELKAYLTSGGQS